MRSRGRSGATSRCRCPTTSCTARTRRSRPSARSRCGSPRMSSEQRIAANVAQWTKTNAEYTDAAAAASWTHESIDWGLFKIEDEWLGDVAGLDVVELGCGTAYFSAWLARAGA